MSKIGKEVISALKESKKKGLVTIQTLPNVSKQCKKIKISKRTTSSPPLDIPKTLRK